MGLRDMGLARGYEDKRQKGREVVDFSVMGHRGDFGVLARIGGGVNESQDD